MTRHEAGLADWTAFHLYYHGNLDRMLDQLVRPLVAGLWREGWIESFFFLRYPLGGPHVRLRLKRAAGRPVDALQQRVVDAAQAFFTEFPSDHTLPEEATREINRRILADDPHEWDDRVFPNHHVERSAFVPETDRYGGPEVLDRVLDSFALSSCCALELIAERKGEERSHTLLEAFASLASQAKGLAENEEELLDLVGWGVSGWGNGTPRLLAKADEVFERNAAALAERFRKGWSAPAGALLQRAGRSLAAVLRDASESARLEAKASSLHVSAVRLGLVLGEEVYVSRLLTHAARGSAFEPAAAGRPDELPDLARQALGALASLAAAAGEEEREAPVGPRDGRGG